MSLQELFRNTAQLDQFEKAARAQGYTQFNKRGAMYCHSDLNIFAAGYAAGVKQTKFVLDSDPQSQIEAGLKAMSA